MSKFILFLLILSVSEAQAQTTNITGPAGSGQFGKTVTVLPNGNYVVTDPLYDEGAIPDVGAVYLFNGSTHTLISTLKGISANDQVGGNAASLNDIIILNNGNYLVKSPKWDNGAATDAGAITWCSGITGVSGIVSSSNSLIGSSVDDFSNNAVTILSNGNYLVSNPKWDNGAATDAGAVTWGNGIIGVSGVISSTNSVVGNSTNDGIGNYTITILSNDNYVVRSTNWDNGSAADAGAVTWGNGTAGVSGIISNSNSLVGATANDQVGSGGITVLNNGNYVVRSQLWDNGAIIDAGAVTWGNGTAGVSGIIDNSNSLVGATTNDQVGSGGVTVLNNGNYVVSSQLWDNGTIIDAGATTWGNGTTGISGVVSGINSLVGSAANDQVGSGVITTLSNGNYVVSSSTWDNGTVSNAGAITWGNGTTGISGVVSSSNSLVGSAANDLVGFNGVTALSNGNYVVCSPFWKNGIITSAGAATWGNGATGISGEVSNSNSLVGSISYDYVGRGGVTPLSNGNYVVRSPDKDGSFIDEGAATWGNGNTGVWGAINSSNSLLGIQPNYRVGDQVTALSNGNYVVTVPRSGSFGAHYSGAVIWCNGTTGISGGGLMGSVNFDGVGNGIYLINNGNYVVISPNWDNGAAVDAGAATFGNGAIGISGVVSSSNSLVGSTSYDRIGENQVVTLNNSNYIVRSSWSNGGAYAAGAVTLGNGTTGVSGEVSSSNSLVGSIAYDWVGSGGIAVQSNSNYYVVSSPSWDNGVITDAGAITLGNVADGVAGIITSCNSFTGSTAGEGSSLNFDYNESYDYLVVGRPLNNIVSIFKPISQSLANSLDTVSISINGNSATPLITSTGCRIIASLSPSLPFGFVNGIVNAKTWIESAVPTQNGDPFVARHYEITPVTNPTFSGGRITLYFTQPEFNDFNTHAASTLNLPTGDGDAIGKANLRIGKYSGTSSDGSGLPWTYSGTAGVIDPNDANIVWNNSLSRWEVSFDVFGFGGFIIQTSLNVLPVALLEFNGRLVNNNGVLNWKTTEEVNTLSFDIERSTDRRHYSAVGHVVAINQPGVHLYNYTDNNIISLGASIVYYRLKQSDLDGRFTYSRIIALSIDNSKSVVLFYPNPVALDEANLVITVNEAGRLQGRIIDNTGRVIRQQQWNAESGSSSLQVNVSGLAKGSYYLELRGSKIDERILFVKQ